MKIGDIFKQIDFGKEVKYKVVGFSANGNPISEVCKNGEVETVETVETVEEVKPEPKVVKKAETKKPAAKKAPAKRK